MFADTTIFIDYMNIHHSDAYYEDPMVFRPERFLDDQGKFVSSPHSLPFATGKSPWKTMRSTYRLDDHVEHTWYFRSANVQRG